MSKVSLHQYLSKTGIFKTKKEIIDTIRRNEISVNHIPINNPMYHFDIKKRVLWNGKELKYINKKIYIILNKPLHHICSKLTRKDKELKKKSVFELIKENNIITQEIKKTLFSVGRLDENTRGLLIITNDGVLCSKIINPTRIIWKTYQVFLKNPINKNICKEVEQGIVIGLEENNKIKRYRTKSCKIKVESNDRRRLIISIREGKKREIRRIFQEVGNKVLDLRRVSIGKLSLEDLRIKEGEYTIVDKEYIKSRLNY